MTQNSIDFVVVGRVVEGDTNKGQTHDTDGQPYVIKSGPNKGQPATRFYFGLAIPKSDPGIAELWAKLVAAGKSGFPHLFDAAGNCTIADFSWKFRDGDTHVNSKTGKKLSDKEGCAGNMILGFSSTNNPFQCYCTGGHEPMEIPLGSFVRVFGSIKPNCDAAGNAKNPGVYVNCKMVEFAGYGEPIKRGIDAQTLIGSAGAIALPAGASPVPIMPAVQPGALPGQPMPAAPPMPVAPPAVSPAIVPDPSFLNAVVRIGGIEYARAALLAKGWTEEQINAQAEV